MPINRNRHNFEKWWKQYFEIIPVKMNRLEIGKSASECNDL